MEEPRRRARRVQQAPPEERAGCQPQTHCEPQTYSEPQTPETAAQDMHENAPHRRRRVQQAQQVEIPAPAVRQEQPHAGQNKRKTNKVQKRVEWISVLMRALLGMAVLLSMVGAALVRAAKRIRREHLRVIAMALCALVAIVSAWQVGSILLRTVRTNRLNDSLSEQRAAMIEAQEETDAQMTVFEPAEQPQAVDAAQPEPEIMPETAPLEEAEILPAAEQAAPDVVKTTKYRRIGGDALPEMAQLHQQNRDLVAWIQIPDVLDLPVVYRDNKYYLTRDFSKQKNTAGTIFLDENHPFKEKTQNLLLHGHNMKDGTMFGRLAQYLYDDTYLRNHPFIYFDTLWNKEQYVIFAVLDVSLQPSNERFFNYFTHDTFSSDAEFAMYIRQLQLRSEYAIPIDVTPSDALLTLSTCLDEDRLVIVCRRLRENETRSDLRTLIRMATRQ